MKVYIPVWSQQYEDSYFLVGAFSSIGAAKAAAIQVYNGFMKEKDWTFSEVHSLQWDEDNDVRPNDDEWRCSIWTLEVDEEL